MKSKAIFLFLALALVGNSALAAPRCARAHDLNLSQVDRFSRVVYKLLSFGTKGNDTTENRGEEKTVVNFSKYQEQIQHLQAFFKDAMVRRDKLIEGFANMTRTFYMPTTKYTSLRNVEEKVKVRFRKYFLRVLADKARRAMTPAKGFEDISWMEIKINHPDFPTAVKKLRLKVFDKDIRSWTNETLFVHQKEILAMRLKKLNPGKEGLVDLYVEFFNEMYSNPARRVDGLFAETEYERASYSIFIPHISDPNKTLEVQLTADYDILLVRLGDKEQFKKYMEYEIASEVKVPTSIQFTDQDLANYPGLNKVLEFKKWLIDNHNPAHPINRGKKNKIDKNIDRSEKDSKHDEDVLDHLMEIMTEILGLKS